MVAHLRRLGFESVSNRNVDCYAEWASGTAPDYDVLITNPPYSGDHMPRCLRFVAASRRPWLLLLPNFVCRKRDFAATTRDCPPAYLVPQHRYVYYAPGRREEATQARLLGEGSLFRFLLFFFSLPQATSPFDSFWYLYLGPAEQADPLLAWWERKYARASGCTLARSPDALPAPVREEPRANPRARRREAKRAAFLHKEFGVARAHVRPAKAKKAKQNAAAEQQQQHPPG